MTRRVTTDDEAVTVFTFAESHSIQVSFYDSLVMP